MARLPGVKFGNDEDVCQLTHTFSGPMYIRQMIMPKGVLLTGKIHRFEHPIFFMSGDVSVFDEFVGPRRIKAPCYYVSKPGTKRVMFAHEDAVIVTIHYVGEERDVAKIEDWQTVWFYEDYEKGLRCEDTVEQSKIE